MIILAIDPGITGALAFFSWNSPRPGLLAVDDMPILNGDVNPHELSSIIKIMQPNVAILEHVHPHPNEGVSSVWRFSAAYTTARITLALLNIPTILMPPTKWKRAMNVRGGALGKEQCRKLAIERFPALASHFSRKKDHGRAEAALLAMYASTLPTIRSYQSDPDLHPSQSIIS